MTLRRLNNMKLTLKSIKEIKRNTENKLTKRVCDYVIDEWSSYDDKKHIFTDVLYHGCQSGMVGFLIWYSDTTAFYKKYKFLLIRYLLTHHYRFLH